ncbi:MAG: ABC transporter substrate-binding protein [Candidatus Competibacter sp.]|nr:ABC transporter substrate-binding protein [Candidatus Competibacter sp.]
MSGMTSVERWYPGTGAGSLAILVALVVCCSPPDPIRIGFVGGISGRVADLGVAGRNGTQLAVELHNQAGGVAGRQLELIVRDDEQNPEVAERVTRELIARGVVAIVGPMTSAMAMRMLPIANEAKVLLVSPTVTTTELSGRDDYFFRAVSSTHETATKNARYQLNSQGPRRMAVAYDLTNQSYTENWLNDFRDTFVQGGGAITQAFGFKSGGDTLFLPIATALLATQPDGVLIVANSVDSALLCQQIRKLDPRIPITIAEWGATERLVELGGKAVEGVTATQLFDRDNNTPAYRVFRQRYRDRFGQEPGFGGTAALDATNVVLDALARRRSGQDLKEVLLAMRRFEGVQQPLDFDDYGDTKRAAFITVVRDGQFVRID